jgi:hypothetical protein
VNRRRRLVRSYRSHAIFSVVGRARFEANRKNCTSSPSTVGSVGNGFVRHGTTHLRNPGASIAFLFVASQFWRECVRVAMVKPGVYAPHSQASSPRFVASPQLPSPRTSLRKKHLAYCLLTDSRFRTGDLHPTSSRPCWAYRVHRNSVRAVPEVDVTSLHPVTLVVLASNRSCRARAQ